MSAKTRTYKKNGGENEEKKISPPAVTADFSPSSSLDTGTSARRTICIGYLGIRILWVTLPARDRHPAEPIDKRREGRKRLSLVRT